METRLKGTKHHLPYAITPKYQNATRHRCTLSVLTSEKKAGPYSIY